MSTFGYNDYQNAVAAAQNKNSGVKVGWFKLADDGDEALVRFNVSSVEDLQFASIHSILSGGRWIKVSCLAEFGSYTNNCPLCAVANNGNTMIGKSSKKVYIQTLVSYRDSVTGQWSAYQPVIMEKPAGFSKEIANLLRDYKDLRNVLIKVTRNGKAKDMKTTYSMMPANPDVFRPEMIPADFSAFTNFKLEKHSFYVKTADEINTFLRTGSFPEREVATGNTVSNPSQATIANAYGQAPAAYSAPQSYNPAPQPSYGYGQPAAQAVNNNYGAATPAQPAQSSSEQPAEKKKWDFGTF